MVSRFHVSPQRRWDAESVFENKILRLRATAVKT
jgi:hypothetical protein